MKSCKSCGCVNDNINRFCRNCGSPFDSEKPNIPPASPSVPDEAEYMPDEAEYMPDEAQIKSEKDFFDLTEEPTEEIGTLFGMMPPLPPENAPGYIDFDLGEEETEEPERAERAGVSVLKAVAASPLSLALALFTSCTFALQLAQVLFTFDEYYDVICHWLYIFGFDRMGAAAFSAVAVSAAVLLRLICAAPMLLFVTGLWLHYASARKGGDGLSVGGLHLLSAGSILRLIVSSLGAAVCVLSCAGLLASFTYTEAEAHSIIVGSFAAVAAMGIGCIVSILYYCMALGTLGSMKAVAKGADTCRVSVFVMAVNLLCALIYAAVTGFYLAQPDILSVAMAASEMVTLVLLTLVMVRYRIELKENKQ